MHSISPYSEFHQPNTPEFTQLNQRPKTTENAVDDEVIFADLQPKKVSQDEQTAPLYSDPTIVLPDHNSMESNSISSCASRNTNLQSSKNFSNSNEKTESKRVEIAQNFSPERVIKNGETNDDGYLSPERQNFQNQSLFHTRKKLGSQEQHLEQDLPPRSPPNETPSYGKIGLVNIGNTCFLNAALQCLVHNETLKQFFLSNQYKMEINTRNPLGTQGRVLEALGAFFHEYFNEPIGPITPRLIKNEVNNFTSAFRTLQQHDSQEFFGYILDFIHEDSNRILMKPLTEDVEGKMGEPVHEVARRSWVQYLRRNASIVSENFVGQFKHTTKCPNPYCGYQTTKFEVFSVLSLSEFGIKFKKAFIKYVIDSVSLYGVFEVEILALRSFNKISQRELLALLADEYKLDIQRLRLCFFEKGFFTELLEETMTMDEILSKISRRKSLGIIELSEESAEISRTEDAIEVNVTIDWKKEKSDEDDAGEDTATRVIFMKPNHTFKDLIARIFQFVYPRSSSQPINQKEQKPLSFYNSLVDEIFAKNEKNQYFETDVIFPQNSESLDTIDSWMTIESIAAKTNDQKHIFVQIRLLLPSMTHIQFNFDHFWMPILNKNDDIMSRTIKSPKDIPEKPRLEDLLSSFAHTEILDEANKWHCPGCKLEVRAEKSIEIYKAPRYLAIHFKKVKTERQHNEVTDFPLEFDFSKWVVSPETPSSYNVQPDEYMPPELIKQLDQTNRGMRVTEDTRSYHQPLYQLKNIVYHFGMQHFGHNFSVCRIDNEWIEFNDEFVTVLGSSEKVSVRDAYFLVYERYIPSTE